MTRLVMLSAKALAAAAGLVVLFGFAGRIHPVFDTVSLVRPLAALLCLFFCLVPRAIWLRSLLLVVACAGLITTTPLLLPGTEGGTLRVYSKNLFYRHNQLPALAQDIRISGADVVLLQEVSDRNRGILAMLEADFPFQHLCRPSGWSGIAVLSRVPLEAATCSARRGLAAARILHEGAPVWVASIHLPWPFPYPNGAAAEAVADRLVEMEDAPVVMAGDFNIFPWAASVRFLRRAGGTEMAQPLRPTYELDGLPLFLDHVHATGGGTVSYRPALGSDHLGLLADLRLTR